MELPTTRMSGWPASVSRRTCVRHCWPLASAVRFSGAALAPRQSGDASGPAKRLASRTPSSFSTASGRSAAASTSSDSTAAVAGESSSLQLLAQHPGQLRVRRCQLGIEPTQANLALG